MRWTGVVCESVLMTLAISFCIVLLFVRRPIPSFSNSADDPIWLMVSDQANVDFHPL
jgi:hypothetical protein